MELALQQEEDDPHPRRAVTADLHQKAVAHGPRDRVHQKAPRREDAFDRVEVVEPPHLVGVALEKLRGVFEKKAKLAVGRLDGGVVHRLRLLLALRGESFRRLRVEPRDDHIEGAHLFRGASTPVAD